MDEKERQPFHEFHEEVKRIAQNASIRIKVLEGKARNTQKNAMLIPPDTPGPLRDLPPPYQAHYFREAAKEKRIALRDIEEVIGRMPPHATDRDKGLVRAQAYDELGGREKILREKAERLQRGYEVSSSSRQPGQAHTPEAKDAHPPRDPGQDKLTGRLKVSKYLKEMPQKEAATKDLSEQSRVQPPMMTERSKGAQALASKGRDADKSQEHAKTPGDASFTNRLNISKFLSPEHQAYLEKARQQKERGVGRDEK